MDEQTQTQTHLQDQASAPVPGLVRDVEPMHDGRRITFYSRSSGAETPEEPA